MKEYHINVNTIVLEANSEEEVEELYREKIEDPLFCIDVLKDYEIVEGLNECGNCGREATQFIGEDMHRCERCAKL